MNNYERQPGFLNRAAKKVIASLLKVNPLRFAIYFLLLAVTVSVVIAGTIDFLWDGKLNQELEFASVVTPLFDALILVVFVTAMLNALRAEVTRREEIEKALQHSNEDLQLLLDSMAESVFGLDRNGSCTFVNKAFLDSLGYQDKNEVVGRNMHALIHHTLPNGEPYAEHECRLSHSYVTQQPVHVTDEVYWRKDGTPIPVECYSYPIIKNGEAIGAIATFTDITERKRAEQELKAAARYSRSLIEASLDPLVTIDDDGSVMDVNAATEKVTGINRDKLIGTDFSLYFTEPEMAQKGYQQAFANGSVTDYPLAIRHISGKVTDVLYNATTYFDEHGAVAGIFAAARDVTDYKAAQSRIRMLSTAIEQSPASVVIANLNAEIEYVNPRFTEVTGYSQEEAVGKNPRVLQSGLTDKSVYPDMWARLTNGQPWTGNFINKRKNGEMYYEEAHISPVKDNDGNVSHYVAVKLDITDRKKMEDSLRANAQYMRSLIEASIDPLAAVSVEGKITDLNQAAEQMAGLSRLDMIGTDFWLYFTEPEKARAGYQEVLTQGSVKDYPLTMLHASGKVTDVLYNASVYRNANGEIAGVFAAARDVTEHKRMEEAVRQLALHDSLTKLPNRRLLSDRLGQAMDAGKRSHCHGALMFLDLDNFKPLNDLHGHLAGDALLVEVASRLKKCVRETDTVARIGGDEFVVMLAQLDQDKAKAKSEAMAVAEKIRTALAEHYVLQISEKPAHTVEHHCTASIGVVLFTDHKAGQDDILKLADNAMYQAKDAGRNRIRFHDDHECATNTKPG